MRRSLLLTIPAALVISGCASHTYVNREVGEVNKKVDGLTTEVEQTQQRLQRDETRIDEVNNSSQSGINEAKGSAQQAITKADAAEKAAKGKLIYTVTLSNDKVTFPFDHSEVSPDAKKLIDDAITDLTTQNKGVYFEIEGHTDATGPDDYNLKLGEERAVAVRNYLHDQHGIALNRMQVISYGKTKPVSDNNTPQDRAQNRRVVIKVLE